MAEAISLAEELKDMYSLATALGYAASLDIAESNPAELERYSSDKIELSTRHHFGHWLAVGSIHRGWVRSASDDTAQGIALIEQGIRDYRATASVLGLPIYLLLLGRKLAARTASRSIRVRRQTMAVFSFKRWRGPLR
jgi:hypothetical protein